MSEYCTCATSDYCQVHDEIKALWTTNAQLKARLAAAVAAVQAFADHFGPLEDNHMLNDECRHCFALARGVLGTADSASGGANG